MFKSMGWSWSSQARQQGQATIKTSVLKISWALLSTLVIVEKCFLFSKKRNEQDLLIVSGVMSHTLPFPFYFPGCGM